MLGLIRMPVSPYRSTRMCGSHPTRSWLDKGRAAHFAVCELDLACTYAMRRPKLAAECARQAMRFAQMAGKWGVFIRAAKLMEAL